MIFIIVKKIRLDRPVWPVKSGTGSYLVLLMSKNRKKNRMNWLKIVEPPEQEAVWTISSSEIFFLKKRHWTTIIHPRCHHDRCTNLRSPLRYSIAVIVAVALQQRQSEQKDVVVAPCAETESLKLCRLEDGDGFIEMGLRKFKGVFGMPC